MPSHTNPSRRRSFARADYRRLVGRQRGTDVRETRLRSYLAYRLTEAVDRLIDGPLVYRRLVASLD
jgi:hypothetical protein